MTVTSEKLLYFASPSATPASTLKTNTNNLDRTYSGRDIQTTDLHAAYMSDIHLRRLRKAKAPPPADAAGLIAGSRYGGRGTPLKGKAHAPPDQKEAKWVSCTSTVRGSSAAGTRYIFDHSEDADDANAAANGQPVRPHTSHGGHRPLAKVQEQSYKSSLGTGMSISKEDPKKANSKKLGAFAPKVKTERVFGGRVQQDTARDQVEDSIWPPSKCRSWAAYVADAQVKQDAEARLQTAPGKMERSMTLARKQYHAASVGNQDVLRYRHSEGICPAEYKFNEVRKSTPPLEVKPPGSAKDVFFDTRSSYSCNRVKGMMSTIVY